MQGNREQLEYVNSNARLSGPPQNCDGQFIRGASAPTYARPEHNKEVYFPVLTSDMNDSISTAAQPFR
jgi:hypothetical protein